MTLAQLDHLRAIDAHLKHLLDIAAKRTPGEWVKGYNNDTGRGRSDESFWEWWEAGPARCEGVRGKADATFIASCAGNAEAGWKYALKHLRTWLRVHNEAISKELKDLAAKQLESILSAFPLESLKAPH